MGRQKKARPEPEAPEVGSPTSDSGPGSEPAHRDAHRSRATHPDDGQPPFSLSAADGVYSSMMRNQSSTSAGASLRRFSMGAPSDDEEAVSGRWGDAAEERRRMEDERRVAQILANPQMRSAMLLGSGNNKYQWYKYWTTVEEMEDMKKPIRKYYERVNDLIRQYMFIDTLLDSTIPHELLSEYSERLDASACRPLEIPQTITEESHSMDSSPGGSPPWTPSPQPAITPKSPDRNPPGRKKRVKRTPKDIFRPSESTPLLSRDEEEGNGGSGQVVEPYTPWLDEADLDHDDPIVSFAIYVNTAANVLLLVAKIIVVASVPSMSVLASLVDAVLDFLSTAIVWITTSLISASQRDQYRYPVGRRRLEPVGVLVFSIIMITAFCQVGMESINRLLSSDHEVLDLGVPALLVMLSTVVVKGAMWVWCRLIKNSSVRALADDAMTDVIFNTGSIIFPIVGAYARVWWLDSLGGLVLSVVVVFTWGVTSLHHMRNLTGFSAQPDERNLLLYLTMRFSDAIKQIQNLRAYHAGDKLFVEVDIILEARTPLKDSHDVGEVLTYFLESVPIVDRAFVHIDYDSYNVPTHVAS
ncbi:related to cation diffusion facilitator 10 [Cephalotrichum gorgonifer]|uniref:Related to cation diffusion facilitator 10 n=1 Tax=Cephalotrichum gorgonifer TaxID=2041049 RepID=A0AAE8N3B7_9PEZI|nr:related to cation diffusion facilitator 10 [Cephalotrichum gorgonifer]